MHLLRKLLNNLSTRQKRAKKRSVQQVNKHFIRFAYPNAAVLLARLTKAFNAVIATLLVTRRVFSYFCAVAALLVSSALAAATLVEDTDYNFPIHNPFQATITGTPAQLQPQLIKQSSIKQKDYQLSLHPEREQRLPSNFWPVKRLHYRLAEQKHAAPLIFIIAGTGARYDSGKNEYLKKLFYAAGMHVVQISSPTSYDFMAAASQYATPGFSPLDAHELYQVMQTIASKHAQLPVTQWHLTGYSLGGLHAAFINELDARHQVFNFERTLLLNPPVNLLTSVQNLDKMANVQLPKLHQGHDFYQEVIDKLARYFEQRGHFNLNQAILTDFQNSPERFSDAEMAMLIGSMFRFTVTDISFTADLINRRGLITPTDTWITIGTNLTPFFEIALTCDFSCYIEQQLLPFWQNQYQGGDLHELVQQTSLYALSEHLQNTPSIAVMHNQDDIILGPGDLTFLQRVFGERLTLYPYGGHMGNLDFARNADDILSFFHE